MKPIGRNGLGGIGSLLGGSTHGGGSGEPYGGSERPGSTRTPEASAARAPAADVAATAASRNLPHGRESTMAQRQSILGRIAQLTRANINNILDKAEDPEKMLDQLVRDYTSSIAEAEEAVAQTIGNLRMAEADHAEDVAAAKEWGRQGAGRLPEGRQPPLVRPGR